MLKRCSKCGEFKSATLKNFAPNKNTKSKLQSWCRFCKAADYKRYRNTDAGKRARSKAKKYEKRYPSKYVYRRKYYGLTAEQHKKLYLKQNGCCKICNMAVPYNKIVTDHNHNTGKVRGLLCRCCNSGLGMFKDNISALHSAAFYLSK